MKLLNINRKDELIVLLVCIAFVTYLVVFYEPSYHIRDEIAKEEVRDSLNQKRELSDKEWEKLVDKYRSEYNGITGMAAKRKDPSVGNVIGGILLMLLGYIMLAVGIIIALGTVWTEMGDTVCAVEIAAGCPDACAGCIFTLIVAAILIFAATILLKVAFDLFKGEKEDDSANQQQVRNGLQGQAQINKQEEESGSNKAGQNTTNQ